MDMVCSTNEGTVFDFKKDPNLLPADEETTMSGAENIGPIRFSKEIMIKMHITTLNTHKHIVQQKIMNPNPIVC